MATLLGTADTLARAHKHFCPCYHPQPMVLARGEGSLAFDVEGRRYVDLAGGHGVTVLGHGHPGVLAAITEQAGRFLHASSAYTSAPLVNVAERLCSLSFAERVFLCTSGAEANEAAFKLARRHFHLKGEGRFEIVAAIHGFHGRTLGTLSATGEERLRAGFAPLVPGFRYVTYGDLKSLAQALGPRTAAVILEPVQGEAGVVPPPPGYLQAARVLCNQAGCLLVLDEVHSGMGRTGTLWAYQQEDVVPDVLTLAKGVANGLPLGAMLTTAALAESLGPGMHGSTFGGNPVSCAAAAVVLDQVAAPGFLEAVRAKGEVMRGYAERLATAHPALVAQVRGRGLWMGMELKREAQPLVDAARQRGVLCHAGPSRVLRLAPALNIPDALLEEGFHALDLAAADVMQETRP